MVFVFREVSLWVLVLFLFGFVYDCFFRFEIGIVGKDSGLLDFVEVRYRWGKVFVGGFFGFLVLLGCLLGFGGIDICFRCGFVYFVDSVISFRFRIIIFGFCLGFEFIASDDSIGFVV